MPAAAVCGEPAETEVPVMLSSTFFTISSMFLLSMNKLLFAKICFQRMQRLSHITQRRRFVKVAALVSPSPVRLAMVKVQNPSPPKPIAE